MSDYESEDNYISSESDRDVKQVYINDSIPIKDNMSWVYNAYSERGAEYATTRRHQGKPIQTCVLNAKEDIKLVTGLIRF